MNILYLIECSEPGGAENLVLSLAKGFRSRGHNCIVGLLEEGWLLTQLQKHHFKTFMLHQNTSYDFSCVQKLRRIIRENDIDIIHSHEFMMNIYGAIAGFLAVRPVITTVHGKNYYWQKARRRLAYRIACRLSTMVAVSEDLKYFMAERVRISPRRILTVPNGIDIQEHDVVLPIDTSLSLRSMLEIPPKSPVVGTVGMLVPAKDHITLLKAASHVIEEYPSVIFLIIGEGDQFEFLKSMTQQLGIWKNVRFAGFRDCVPNLLQIMDIYVCSSISEGLSLSLLEAMAACKPVVATNVGGNPEIVLHRKTGLLVAPREPESFATRITLLLKDKVLAQRLGMQGRHWVQEKFSLERMLNNYQQLYQRLALRKLSHRG